MSMQEAAKNSRAATNALHRISSISRILALRDAITSQPTRSQQRAFERDVQRIRQDLECLQARAESLIVPGIELHPRETANRTETSK